MGQPAPSIPVGNDALRRDAACSAGGRRRIKCSVARPGGHGRRAAEAGPAAALARVLRGQIINIQPDPDPKIPRQLQINSLVNDGHQIELDPRPKNMIKY